MDGLEDLTQRIGEVLADQPVVFSYVFGSVARGVAGVGSDVDVAVHFESGVPTAERFDHTLRIGVELERALGREVDLVDLADAPLRLVGRILTERVVVTGLQRPERVRFENEMFRLSVDFEHHAGRLDAAEGVCPRRRRRHAPRKPFVSHEPCVRAPVPATSP